MDSVNTIIQAHKLHKQFGDFTAVNQIDFEIPRGKCFGFLGPNGAGKTTTLSMLIGTTPLTSGELSIFELNMPEHGREVRSRTGVVPQGDNLDPDFTVKENLELFASYFGFKKAAISDRINELLKFVSLTEKANEKTDHLSGGMKRRLTIARALINDPELVLLDEPTTGLDPQVRHIIWGRLSELRSQGKTLILTTHYMEEAERLCDELVIMDHGKILDQGSPQQLIAKHIESDVIEIRGTTDSLTSEIETIANVRVESLGSSLYCYTNQPAPLIDLLQQHQNLVYSHRPTGLEDVFMKLTGRELRE